MERLAAMIIRWYLAHVHSSDNFEEQLVGKNIGDDVEVNVTFPENYQAEELQGKPAVFKVPGSGD